MKDLHIRKVLSHEAGQLQHLGQQTFYEAFADQNTPENMTKYLTDKFSLHTIIKELQHPFSEFYFAQHADRLVGYLKLNFELSKSANPDGQAMEIERIYVTKPYQGKQVGQQLIDFAIQRALKTKASHIWLGVWEQNKKAIQFYQKNGFKEMSRHIFILGDDQQTDLMMKLDLVK